MHCNGNVHCKKLSEIKYSAWLISALTVCNVLVGCLIPILKDICQQGWQVIFGSWKNNSINDFILNPVELCSFLFQVRVELNILGCWKLWTLIFWFIVIKMNLMKQQRKTYITFEKIGSCCRMYFYYEINVRVEVTYYLFSGRSFNIFKKNYLEEQCYITIM